MLYGRGCEELSGNDTRWQVMSESREVRIPEDLCAAAVKKFGDRFSSVEELVAFLLRELVSADAVELDQAEQAVVEQRLKDLGYL